MGDVIDFSKYVKNGDSKFIEEICGEVAPFLVDYLKSLPPGRDVKIAIVALCTWVCEFISEIYPEEEWEEMGKLYGDYFTDYLSTKRKAD